MAALNLNVEAAIATCDSIAKASGPDILEKIVFIAALGTQLDANVLTDQFLACGKKLQVLYNGFIETTIRTVVSELKKVPVLDEYLRKQNIGEVGNHGVEADNVNLIPAP
jgi:hypothetical protein